MLARAQEYCLKVKSKNPERELNAAVTEFLKDLASYREAWAKPNQVEKTLLKTCKDLFFPKNVKEDFGTLQKEMESWYNEIDTELQRETYYTVKDTQKDVRGIASKQDEMHKQEIIRQVPLTGLNPRLKVFPKDQTLVIKNSIKLDSMKVPSKLL